MSDSPENTEIGFQDFGFDELILKGIEEAGFREPSPIQQKAIPVILNGNDMIGQAQTGTGKTAAFGLPAMQLMDHDSHVELLVIAPTRELASQISDEMFRLGRFANIRSMAIYGGQSYGQQLKRLAMGPQIVSATPGRLLDLISSGRMPGFAPKIVVLDEADEMLDMGFLEEIETIFDFLPHDRQTLMFSATMSKPIRKLADRLLKDPVHIKTNTEGVAASNVTQQYYVIADHERDDAILRLIDSMAPAKSILFCRTKAEVDRVSGMLEGRGFLAKGLHGDMDQNARNKTIARFRDGSVSMLVATDVAARGLDVADVTHVFNFHIPFDTESYVHRIGRTGRAGRAGVAVTLVNKREFRGIQRIQKELGKMEAGQMPTGTEVRRAALDKLGQSIMDQRVSDDAEMLMDDLERHSDPRTIAQRAIALLMKDEEPSGPELIGLSHGEIKKLQSYGGGGGGRGRGKGGYQGRGGGRGGRGGPRGRGGPGGPRGGKKHRGQGRKGR